MKTIRNYELGIRNQEQNPLPNPLPEGEGTGGARPVSLGAALLFFFGLGAGVCAVGAGVLFFWPWLVRGAAWVGWVIGNHPGLVMIGLMGVAVGALRLARWLDERE